MPAIMAPAMKQPTDTILHLFNDDFFKHKHCPMRTGNVRCRNKSTCDRVDFGSQAGPQNAVKLRDQLMRQIDIIAPEQPCTTSPVWSGIETKVEMLVDWVLCKKHLMQRDAAIRMTMSFLKQDCGIFVEEQKSAPLHKQYPADNMPSTASYHSAGTHLATPPMSPATTTQGHVHQHPFVFKAGESANKSFTSGHRLEKLQHAPFVFPVGNTVKHDPVKIEPGNDHATTPPPQYFRNSSQDFQSSSSNMHANAKPTSPQQVPFGFGVRSAPSKTKVTQSQPVQQPPAKPTQSKQPLVAHQVQNEPAVEAQITKSQVPFGFQVRPRSEQEGPILPSTPPKTPSNKPAHEKSHKSSTKVSHESASKTPRSQLDEMVDNLEALQLSNEKLEKEKKCFEARWRRAEDRVGELEDENEDLKSEIRDLKGKFGQLEKEMTALWKVVGARD